MLRFVMALLMALVGASTHDGKHKWTKPQEPVEPPCMDGKKERYVLWS